MLTRDRIVREIERALFDREPQALKWFAQDALTAQERWEGGAENLIGETLHILGEWGEPAWPLTGDDAWEIANSIKTHADPEEALDAILLRFREPNFVRRRELSQTPARGGFRTRPR